MEGIELIKCFEGFRSEQYICAGGFPTIGYGHKIRPRENLQVISVNEAGNLLTQDIYQTEKTVSYYINIELNDNQFASLVSFTFNVGAAALQRSTLRQKINYGLYDECHHEFLKWVYARSRKLSGLFKRRLAESQLFYKT